MNQDSRFDRIAPENMFDSGDLKVLICYLLATVGEPVPATETAQLFHYEGISNYFDVQTAFYDLEQDGHIEQSAGGKDLYRVSEKGRVLSHTLKESVSPILRDKVYHAVVKMLARYKYERDTDITIAKQPGGYLLTCRMMSGETTLCSYSILLPNEAQANALKEQILTDPKYYYDAFIRLLTEGIPSESKSQE